MATGRAPHTTVGSAGRVESTFVQDATRNIRARGRREHTRPSYHWVATAAAVATIEAVETMEVTVGAWQTEDVAPTTPLGAATVARYRPMQPRMPAHTLGAN